MNVTRTLVATLLIGSIIAGFVQGLSTQPASGIITSYSTLTTYSSWISKSYSYFSSMTIDRTTLTKTETGIRLTQSGGLYWDADGPYVGISWRQNEAGYYDVTIRNLIGVPIKWVILRLRIQWPNGRVDYVSDGFEGPFLDTPRVFRIQDPAPYAGYFFVEEIVVELYRMETITAVYRFESYYYVTVSSYEMTRSTYVDVYTTTVTRIIGAVESTTPTSRVRSETETASEVQMFFGSTGGIVLLLVVAGVATVMLIWDLSKRKRVRY